MKDRYLIGGPRLPHNCHCSNPNHPPAQMRAGPNLLPVPNKPRADPYPTAL